jgi:hypothetical protein
MVCNFSLVLRIACQVHYLSTQMTLDLLALTYEMLCTPSPLYGTVLLFLLPQRSFSNILICIFELQSPSWVAKALLLLLQFALGLTCIPSCLYSFFLSITTVKCLQGSGASVWQGHIFFVGLEGCSVLYWLKG